MRLLSIWKADSVIEKLNYFILFYFNECKFKYQHRVGSYCIGLPTLTARWKIQTTHGLGIRDPTTLLSQVCESCSAVSNSLRPRVLYSPWDSPGQNTRVGSCFLLQGIFPTQGSNPGLCVTYSWLSVSEVPPCTQFCINGSNHDSRFNHDREVLFMYSLLGKNLHISRLLHSTPRCSRVKCNYKRTRGEAGRFIRKLLQWSRGEVMTDRWRQRWKEVASWEYLSGGGARRVRGRKRNWGIEILLDFCFKQLSGWWHYFDMGKAEREATLREETKI